MKVSLTSVFVNDQDAALAFYTEKLGFEVKHNLPMGEHSWLTVVSPEDPEGTELLLEPAVHPAVKPYRDALVADGIALAQFEVENVEAEAERLIEKGVRLVQPPTHAGPVTIAVFDDTCGNLIMIQSSS